MEQANYSFSKKTDFEKYVIALKLIKHLKRVITLLHKKLISKNAEYFYGINMEKFNRLNKEERINILRQKRDSFPSCSFHHMFIHRVYRDYRKHGNNIKNIIG